MNIAILCGMAIQALVSVALSWSGLITLSAEQQLTAAALYIITVFVLKWLDKHYVP